MSASQYGGSRDGRGHDAEHAKACQELVDKNGGVNNAGPFTPWPYRADGAPVKSAVVFPGGLGGANWGGAPAIRTGYVFVVTQDDGALGWMREDSEAPVTTRPRSMAPVPAGAISMCASAARLAVPETAMGPADRRQHVDRRLRLADSARDHRRHCPRASRTPDARDGRAPS